VPQRLFSQFPKQINRENILGIREFLGGIREILIRKIQAAFKRRIVEETARPGASLSEIARSYGIAARVLFRWKQELTQAAPLFVGKSRSLMRSRQPRSMHHDPESRHYATHSVCPFRADTVAKVENRTTPKISRKLIFRFHNRCNAL
jgi:transposase-like protein